MPRKRPLTKAAKKRRVRLKLERKRSHKYIGIPLLKLGKAGGLPAPATAAQG